MRVKSPLVQQALAGITVIFMLGALSMIWPMIMTLFIGLLWLLQSYSAEQEIAVLSWTEGANWLIVVGSIRRHSFPAVLS